MRLIDERTDRVYHLDFVPIVSQTTRPGMMVSLGTSPQGEKARPP